MNLVLPKCEEDDLFSLSVLVAILRGGRGAVFVWLRHILHVGIPLD